LGAHADAIPSLPPTAQPLADLLILRYDPLVMVQLSNAELLRQARDAAHGLIGFGEVN
jgi:hypothetical protein